MPASGRISTNSLRAAARVSDKFHPRRGEAVRWRWSDAGGVHKGAAPEGGFKEQELIGI
jgi:hypothetical protein